MDRRHHRVAVGVIAALVLAAAPVRAQDEVEPPDGSMILFREGVEHLRAGRHPEAVEAFRGSYRLVPRVTTMCNLALAYDRWGPEHREAAIRAYRTCAAEDTSGRFRPHAEERVTALERELALSGEATEESIVEDAPSDDAQDEIDASDSSDAPSEASPSTQPSPREHTLLWIGLGASGLAAVGLVTGIALALDAQGRVAALGADIPDGRIPRGSPEEQRLRDARAIADGATAAYVIAGVLGALAAGLITTDLVLASSDTAAPVTVRISPASISGSF